MELYDSTFSSLLKEIVKQVPKTIYGGATVQFNHEQCGYLDYKLEVAVQNIRTSTTANPFLEGLKYHWSNTSLQNCLLTRSAAYDMACYQAVQNIKTSEIPFGLVSMGGIDNLHWNLSVVSRTGIGKSTLSKELNKNLGNVNLRRLKRALPEKRLRKIVSAEVFDSVGTESNLEPLSKVSANINVSDGTNSEQVGTGQISGDFVGVICPQWMMHPVLEESRRQTDVDKMNVHTNLKGEEAAEPLRAIFGGEAQPIKPNSQDPLNYAKAATAEVLSFKASCKTSDFEGLSLTDVYITAAARQPKVQLTLDTNACLDECSKGIAWMDELLDELNSSSVTEVGNSLTAGEVVRMAGIEMQSLPSHEFEPARKRIRTRNFSDDEIRAMLELMEETLRMGMGPDIWDYVSENLWDQYDFDRDSNTCKNLWGNLLQSYKATCDNDDQQASTGFELVELECRDIIERIVNQNPFEDSRNIQMDHHKLSCSEALLQFQFSLSDLSHFFSAIHNDVLMDDMTEGDVWGDDEGLSGESQVEVTADSHVSNITEPCYNTSSNYGGRKRTAEKVLEDELISRIAPYVNKQIEEAQKPLLSILRRREEDEQKHREKLLAIEEEKLTLKRRKMFFTHSVLANSG
ncbi:hypothetical protein KC19_11G149500 [Ceratodon purpureus]|nr:hypothetical protein KC19_11G149500 [Ceratodon purpureus]KAG0557691.1 hypothetical protein KC19_11G149500 [Ceratodon purpureus]